MIPAVKVVLVVVPVSALIAAVEVGVSDTVLIAAIVAVAPTLAVIATWWNNRITVRTAAKVANAKLDAVHEVVNSKMTAALSEIESLKGEVRGLRAAPPEKGKKPKSTK